jgi:hypothetical protein
MRELHGVIDLSEGDLSSLKRQALLFDRFHIATLTSSRAQDIEVCVAEAADLAFLRAQNLIVDIDMDKRIEGHMQSIVLRDTEFLRTVHSGPDQDKDPLAALEYFVQRSKNMLTRELQSDYMVRYLAADMKNTTETGNTIDVVPICRAPLPTKLMSADGRTEQVLSIALEAFPAPDETCAWQDILAFKADLRDKHWDFRHFLRTLATKPPADSDFQEEIEYFVNRYQRAMEAHKLKASRTAFEAYVIPAIEFLEDSFKFKVSKLAKLVVSAKYRKIELLDAELKAPGFECAYVFEVRKRFGQH